MSDDLMLISRHRIQELMAKENELKEVLTLWGDLNAASVELLAARFDRADDAETRIAYAWADLEQNSLRTP